MARSRTSSAVLLVLIVAAALNGCLADKFWEKFDVIVGQGGDGGKGGSVMQVAKTTQAGILNKAKTVQTASANGGKGGNGVNVGKGFPDSLLVVGKGGNGGKGGTVYQKSVTNQAGIANSATTEQTATANGGDGGVGVNGRKLLQAGDLPDTITIVGAALGRGGKGGRGGNGGVAVAGNGGPGGVAVTYVRNSQVGVVNKNNQAVTTDASGGNGGAASANGGAGGGGGAGNNINGRRLLEEGTQFFIIAGKGGKGGKGGKVRQISNVGQLGVFNGALVKQSAKANGGNGGAGVNIG